MKDNKQELGDERLGTLLRSARPNAELPPGFQGAVWRRIERGEAPSAGLLERVAHWFLIPKLATAGLAVVLLLAGGAGAMRGVRTGEREARERYVASVDPSYLRQR